MHAVGVIDGRGARVDAAGAVEPAGLPWQLDWWIGADDRWHVPAREPAVRQTLIDDVPIVQTAMRVPGGDAVQRVYGAADGMLVVEIENASPAPFVATFVVRGAREVALDGPTAWIDGAPALHAPRAPSRWAASTDATTFAMVAAGSASSEPFPVARDRRGRLEVALLHPVAHRTSLRAAVLLPGATIPDLAGVPDAGSVARAWAAQLDRGLRAELPDAGLAAAVRRARAELLLAPGSGEPVTAAVVAALEDWGFDAEAARAWAELGIRDRRRAARRGAGPATAAELPDASARGDGPELLLTLRRLLVHEGGEGDVTICADLPPAWLGQNLEVHGAPTRRGPVSFAVRWHGPRPALLWDAPQGTTLRAPGLDPTWSSTAPRGDALLAAHEVTA